MERNLKSGTVGIRMRKGGGVGDQQAEFPVRGEKTPRTSLLPGYDEEGEIYMYR